MTTIDAGYDQSEVVRSSILNYIMYAVALAAAVFLVLLRIFCWKVSCVKNLMTKIWNKLFFNFFIRSTVETFLELAINNMIKMYALNWADWYQTLDSSIGVGSLVAITVLALFIPVFLTCKRNQLNTDAFKIRYGSLTQDMRTKNASIRFFFCFFMLRRLIIASLIVFSTARPWLQVQVICLTTSLQLIYIGYFGPYILPWMNWLETTNEFIVLVSTYFMFMYTDGLLLTEHPAIEDLVKDEVTMEQVGWGHTALLGLIVAINMVVMVIVQAYSIHRKVKLWCLKRAFKKKMAEVEKKK